MINGLDIYYSKKSYDKGLAPISKKPQSAKGLKSISTNKGKGCKKIGQGLKILQ